MNLFGKIYVPEDAPDPSLKFVSNTRASVRTRNGLVTCEISWESDDLYVGKSPLEAELRFANLVELPAYPAELEIFMGARLIMKFIQNP